MHEANDIQSPTGLVVAAFGMVFKIQENDPASIPTQISGGRPAVVIAGVVQFRKSLTRLEANHCLFFRRFTSVGPDGLQRWSGISENDEFLASEDYFGHRRSCVDHAHVNLQLALEPLRRRVLENPV